MLSGVYERACYTMFSEVHTGVMQCYVSNDLRKGCALGITNSYSQLCSVLICEGGASIGGTVRCHTSSEQNLSKPWETLQNISFKK